MNSSNALTFFVLGIVVALLCVIALKDQNRSVAADAASAGRYMALMGSGGVNNKSTILTIIDAEKQFMALYLVDENNFSFCQGRFFGYDIFIEDSGKWKRMGYSIAESKKMYLETTGKTR